MMLFINNTSYLTAAEVRHFEMSKASHSFITNRKNFCLGYTSRNRTHSYSLTSATVKYMLLMASSIFGLKSRMRHKKKGKKYVSKRLVLCRK